jgi:uncharacterized repeat protein (TIGR01451 family)
MEALEGRRLLAVSYVYGIDQNNEIFEIDPLGKTQTIAFTAVAPVSGQSNAFAYDRTNPSREFLFFMNGGGSTTGSGQNLYVWNKLTNSQSLVANTTQLGIGSATLQPANAAFYSDAYWFFEEGTATLYKIALDYTGGSPAFSAKTTYDLSGLTDGETSFPAASNLFGDIAINRSTGILYASNTNGAFYSIDINAAAAGTGNPSSYDAIGTSGDGTFGLQLSFDDDYSTLFGQRFIGATEGTWFSINTSDASLTSLGFTSNPAFRDLGGASPIPSVAADLKIDKTDGVNTVFAGDGIIHTYTITVTNLGPDAAENVSVADTWPVEFTGQVIGTPSTGSVSPPVNGSFTWTIGTLAADAVATLTVSYVVPFGTAAKTYDNTVVVSSTTFDPNPDDNTKTDTNRVVSNALAAGTDLGCLSAPFVYVINPYAGTPAVVGQNVGVSNEVVTRFNAYPELPGYRGGVRVAVGDVDGDNIPDVVTAPGPGALARVKVFNLDGTPKAGFAQPYLPFGSSYRDGVEINVGDIDGDGDDDLVAAKSRGPGEVQVAKSSGTAFTSFKSFTAFGGTYRGGATAAIGSQLSNDLAAIFVASGPGMKPTVKYYTLNTNSGALSLASQFNPVMPAGTAGVSLTTQRFVGGVLDTLVAAGRNGNSRVSAYNGGSNVNVANYSTFSAPAPKNNAPVYAAASSLANASGLVDTVFMAQGDGGVGTIKKVSSTNGVVNPVFAPVYLGKPVVSPLRIATNTQRPVLGG